MGIFKKIKNNIKGFVGETKVKNKLNPAFSNVYHKTINNLFIEDEYGKTHQIDHVEIRENGIFCIETKNYNGKIYGRDDDKNWYIYLNRQKFEIMNPLKQNKGHIAQLNKILNNEYNIVNTVVLVKNNAKKVRSKTVINLKHLQKFLKKYNSLEYLTKEEIDDIYEKILEHKAKVSNHQHVKNLKQTEKDFKNGICPRCGAKLVKRNGTKGEFLGCSNFPSCYFTKNL